MRSSSNVKVPNQLLPPLEREFLKLVLSSSGQEIVKKDGYIALPLYVALRSLALLK